MSLYNCKALPNDQFRMIKWSDDLEVQEIYNLRKGWRGRYYCECFAANKETCRHRDMLNWYITRNAFSAGWFIDYEARRWVPLTEVTGALCVS